MASKPIGPALAPLKTVKSAAKLVGGNKKHRLEAETVARNDR